MMIAVWVWKHVPFAAFICFKIIFRLWNWVISNLEAVWWWRRGREARRIMPLLRESIESVYALAAWYKNKEFKWESDPWNGIFDYHSKPWVSVAKNYGDCDDMARLSAWILKDKYPEMRRVCVYSKSGNGHVIVMVRHLDDRWFRMSNQYVWPFKSFEEGVQVYDENTAFWYVY